MSENPPNPPAEMQSKQIHSKLSSIVSFYLNMKINFIKVSISSTPQLPIEGYAIYPWNRMEQKECCEIQLVHAEHTHRYSFILPFSLSWYY